MTIDIPTAQEMADKTQELLDSKVAGLLDKISNGLHDAPGFKTTINLSKEDEKIILDIITKLENLDYKVAHTSGYFEDRPCGGHVQGTLTIDWTPPESGW